MERDDTHANTFFMNLSLEPCMYVTCMKMCECAQTNCATEKCACVNITVPSRMFRMCGFFSFSTIVFPARTTFCIEMRCLATLALLNCYALLDSLVCLEWDYFLTQVFDLLFICGHKLLWCRFALKLGTWKHRFGHHVVRKSRVPGDSGFHPHVGHLHNLFGFEL